MEQKGKYLVRYSEIPNFLEPNVIFISKETFLLIAHLTIYYFFKKYFITTEHYYYYSLRAVLNAQCQCVILQLKQDISNMYPSFIDHHQADE